MKVEVQFYNYMMLKNSGGKKCIKLCNRPKLYWEKIYNKH